jgi:DNA-binding XRE family transcriptional regulator
MKESTMAKNFRELSAPIENDPVRSQRVAEIERGIHAALALAEIRNMRELTQDDIAKALRQSQSNVSRVEHEDDLYISTLRCYVEALGGKLEIAAVFEDDDRVEIALGR